MRDSSSRAFSIVAKPCLKSYIGKLLVPLEFSHFDNQNKEGDGGF